MSDHRAELMDALADLHLLRHERRNLAPRKQRPGRDGST